MTPSLMCLRGVAAVLAAAVCTTVVLADTATEESVPGASRPTVGLALSGGGARGVSHIGVLRVLEQLDVPVDYIAGTSMGAVVGGLYASGLSVDQLEEIVNNTDWKAIFKDELPRPYRTFRRKRDDDLQLAKLKPGVKDGKIGLPSGVIQGEKFDAFLRRWTMQVRDINDFDDLRIPFRAVATDIGTGAPVVMGDGDLVTALRATLSVPGAFAAVRRDGRLLVDGGISNNLPIDVVRDMGADVVIAVDISSPLLPAEEVGSILTISSQLIGIMTYRTTVEQIETLGEQDLLITPDLGDIGSTDFLDGPKGIAIGERAAREAAPELERFAVAGHGGPPPLDEQVSALPVIEFIRIDNDAPIDDALVAARLNVPVGEPLDIDELEQDLIDIYALDVYERVSYRIVEEDGKTGLVIDAHQKSWGVDFLQFGLRLSSDFGGRDDFSLSAAFTKPAVNRLRGEWRTVVRTGRDPLISTEIYQPLDVRSRWFVNAKLSWGSRPVNLFEDGDVVAEVEVDRLAAEVAGGRELGRWGELRTGLIRGRGDTDVEIGRTDEPTGNFDEGVAFAQLSVDTLDSLDFPRSGSRGSLTGLWSRDALGATNEYTQAGGDIMGSRTWGKNTFFGGLRYETTLDGLVQIQDRFLLGGFLNLSGFQQNELSGTDAFLARGVYFRQLKGFTFASVYAGGSIEWGNVFEQDDSFSTSDLIFAGSGFLGLDTPVGPIYAAYGRTEDGIDSLYLLLGRPIVER